MYFEEIHVSQHYLQIIQELYSRITISVETFAESFMFLLFQFFHGGKPGC